MIIKKAILVAKKWISQKPSPKELNPDEVEKVLIALGFELRGKNHDHTTYRWEHPCLFRNPELFPNSIIKVSLGHSKAKKKVVRIGSVRIIIKALECHPEISSEKL